jgi:DNA-binding IclR family transcriptional regulator
MSEKTRKYTGKAIAEQLEVIREVDKNEISEIAQAYGIPLSTISTYLTNRDSID